MKSEKVELKITIGGKDKQPVREISGLTEAQVTELEAFEFAGAYVATGETKLAPTNTEIRNKFKGAPAQPQPKHFNDIRRGIAVAIKQFPIEMLTWEQAKAAGRMSEYIGTREG